MEQSSAGGKWSGAQGVGPERGASVVGWLVFGNAGGSGAGRECAGNQMGEAMGQTLQRAPEERSHGGKPRWRNVAAEERCGGGKVRRRKVVPEGGGSADRRVVHWRIGGRQISGSEGGGLADQRVVEWRAVELE